MAMTVEHYYRILELPLDASSDDIRTRYRQMARVYHPDRYTDPSDKEFVEALMKRVNEAYNGLLRTPRAQIKQAPPPPPTPTIYRTVKGIPTVMAIVLVGVAFVLGAVTVQLLHFSPLSPATASANSAIITQQTNQLAAVECITQTVAGGASVIATNQQPVQLSQSEALKVEASGIGIFPVRASTTTNNQAPLVEPIASVESIATLAASTDTPIPTATALPTNTPRPTSTDEPTATDQPTPPAVATATIEAFVRTNAGVLYIITNPYNVYARAQTSIDSEAASLLVTGQQVLLTGRTGDNYWLRVLLPDGRQAWIYAESAGANSELLSTLPIVSNP